MKEIVALIFSLRLKEIVNFTMLTACKLLFNFVNMSENSFYYVGQEGQKDRLKWLNCIQRTISSLVERCILIGFKLDFRSPFWRKRYL